MTTPISADSPAVPMTGAQASLYQQLRGHLAALKLTAAAVSSAERTAGPVNSARGTPTTTLQPDTSPRLNPVSTGMPAATRATPECRCATRRPSARTRSIQPVSALPSITCG